MKEKSNQEVIILSYKKELNLDFLHIKKMKLDKNRSGGHWLGYSVHFNSLVELPRKSKIDLEKQTIYNASHNLSKPVFWFPQFEGDKKFLRRRCEDESTWGQ